MLKVIPREREKGWVPEGIIKALEYTIKGNFRQGLSIAYPSDSQTVVRGPREGREGL